MKIIKIIFAVIILFTSSKLLLGQEMTKEQKQIIEKVEQQNKLDEQKRNEIEKKLGFDKRKEFKSEYFWEDGIGLTTKNISQGRNLKQYEQGGNFDCREWSSRDKLSFECNLNRVRDFIWQNWMNKTKGYIRVSSDSRDSSNTSHIFIEPNKKGKWSITWRIVSNEITDVLGIISVERVENKPSKGEWALVFKNKSSKIEKTMPYFAIR